MSSIVAEAEIKKGVRSDSDSEFDFGVYGIDLISESEGDENLDNLQVFLDAFSFVLFGRHTKIAYELYKVYGDTFKSRLGDFALPFEEYGTLLEGTYDTLLEEGPQYVKLALEYKLDRLLIVLGELEGDEFGKWITGNKESEYLTCAISLYSVIGQYVFGNTEISIKGSRGSLLKTQAEILNTMKSLFRRHGAINKCLDAVAKAIKEQGKNVPGLGDSDAEIEANDKSDIFTTFHTLFPSPFPSVTDDRDKPLTKLANVAGSRLQSMLVGKEGLNLTKKLNECLLEVSDPKPGTDFKDVIGDEDMKTLYRILQEFSEWLLYKRILFCHEQRIKKISDSDPTTKAIHAMKSRIKQAKTELQTLHHELVEMKRQILLESTLGGVPGSGPRSGPDDVKLITNKIAQLKEAIPKLEQQLQQQQQQQLEKLKKVESEQEQQENEWDRVINLKEELRNLIISASSETELETFNDTHGDKITAMNKGLEGLAKTTISFFNKCAEELGKNYSCLRNLSEADPLFLEIAKEKYDKPRSEWYHFLNIVTGFIEDQDLLNKCINNIKDEVMSQHIKDKYEEVKEQALNVRKVFVEVHQKQLKKQGKKAKNKKRERGDEKGLGAKNKRQKKGTREEGGRKSKRK